MIYFIHFKAWWRRWEYVGQRCSNWSWSHGQDWGTRLVGEAPRHLVWSEKVVLLISLIIKYRKKIWNKLDFIPYKLFSGYCRWFGSRCYGCDLKKKMSRDFSKKWLKNPSTRVLDNRLTVRAPFLHTVLRYYIAKMPHSWNLFESGLTMKSSS